MAPSATPSDRSLPKPKNNKTNRKQTYKTKSISYRATRAAPIYARHTVRANRAAKWEDIDHEVSSLNGTDGHMQGPPQAEDSMETEESNEHLPDEKDFELPSEQKRRMKRKLDQEKKEKELQEKRQEKRQDVRDPDRFRNNPPPKNMKIHPIKFSLPHHVTTFEFNKMLKEHIPRGKYQNLTPGKKPRELYLRPLDTFTFLAITGEKARGRTSFGEIPFEVVFTRQDRRDRYDEKMEDYLNTIVLQNIYEPTPELEAALHSAGLEPVKLKAVVHQDGSKAGRTWVQLKCREKAQKIITTGFLVLEDIQIKVFPYELGPRPRRCTQCQSFDHKVQDCKNTSKCSKCSLEHNTQECPNRGNRQLPLKCANCHQAHKTNASFCEQYLEKKKAMSYAQIAKGRKNNKTLAQKPKTTQDIRKKADTVVQEATKEIPPQPNQEGEFPALPIAENKQSGDTPKEQRLPRPPRKGKSQELAKTEQEIKNPIKETQQENTHTDFEDLINRKIKEQMKELQVELQQQMETFEKKMEEKFSQNIASAIEVVRTDMTELIKQSHMALTKSLTNAMATQIANLQDALSRDTGKSPKKGATGRPLR